MTLRRITVLYALLLLVIIAIANLGIGATFRPVVNALPGGDKAGHFLAMGGLCLLVTLSLAPRRLRLGRRSLPLGPVVVAALVTLEEVSQIWIDSRGFDLLDLTADYLGVLLGGWVALKVVRRGSTPPPGPLLGAGRG